MTNAYKVHPATAAVAAVLAFSPAALAAQDVSVAPSVQDAPASVAPVQAAPAQVAPIQSAPVVDLTAAAPAAPAAPAVIPTVAPPAPLAQAEVPVAAERTTVRSERAPARTERIAAAPAPRPAPATSAPVASAPDALVQAAPLAPVPTPVPTEAVPGEVAAETLPTASAQADDTLPMLGAGALAALALAAAGFALVRRRRNAVEQADWAAGHEPVTVAPQPMARTPQRARRAATPARAGSHVDAAYAGPTEENPFLSLRNRLKRARFLDMQAQQRPAFQG